MSLLFREAKLKIVVEAPFVSAGLQTAGFGLDHTVLRKEGKPAVPGSHVKGLLRQVLEDMAAEADSPITPDQVAGWFGQEASNEESTDAAPTADRSDAGGVPSWQPKEAKIFFSDLVARDAPNANDGSLTRVAVDRRTGTAKDGHLQVIESPYATGQRMTLDGIVRLATDNDKLAIESFQVALDLLLAVGGLKGAGFGRVHCAKISLLCEPRETVLVSAPRNESCGASAHAGIVVRLDAPFLVNARRLAGNHFQGDLDVPGSVLKAAIGRKLALLEAGPRERLSSLLSKCRITSAKPIPEDLENPARPRVPPLSLYSVYLRDTENGRGEDREYYDALIEDPMELAECGEIAFSSDWKADQWNLVSSKFSGYDSSPHRISRTRTAVSVEGVAETARLFTQELISPDGWAWHARLDCPDDHDGDALCDLLAVIGGGLWPIGKTKAAVRATVSPAEPAIAASTTDPAGKVWRITLQSAAVLHGPDGLKPDDRGREAMQSHYRSYFQRAFDAWAGRAGVSPGGGLAVRGYARQQWTGGYLASRYPTHSDGYFPYLLTLPGSVFEIRAPESAQAFFEDLVRMGLPPAEGWPDGDDAWRRFPFVRENGFGEVTIDRRDLDIIAEITEAVSAGGA